MITVVILAKDESRHIRRCIASVRPFAARIVVIDSGSSDDTRDIAAACGADVHSHAWVNYALQFNWALDNAAIETEWVMRLDADEVVLDELAHSIPECLANVPPQVAGLTVNRRLYFMGRWMRHGGIYPRRMLRLFRRGRGRCEARWMDEHIVVDGEVGHLEGDIADINLNDIAWWTAKHTSYALREALDALHARDSAAAAGMDGQAKRIRWWKDQVYYRLPPGLRAILYFGYRYFVRLGFLDGRPGLAFHLLQGLWYRLLVDLRLGEVKRSKP